MRKSRTTLPAAPLRNRSLGYDHKIFRLRLYKALVSVFVLWQLFALTAWLLPYSPGLVASSVRIVRPYMVATGFMQSWQMFAPNPTRLDVYVQAHITYAGGRTRSWDFPRLVDMGYVQRYRHERFHKFIENANRTEYSYLWPAMARYAARRNNTDPAHPPVSVELIRFSRLIPPPGVPIPLYYQASSFYTGPVRAADLKGK